MDNKISKSWSVLKGKLGDSLRSAEGWGGFAVFLKIGWSQKAYGRR